MKILLLNYEFFPIGGGGSTVTKFLAEELVKKGNEVHLITSRYKDLPSYEIINGVHIHRVKVARKHRDRSSIFEMSTYILSGYRYAKQFVSKEKPDIMHAFFVVPSGAVAYILHKKFKIPYIVYLGGSDVPGVDKDRYGIIYKIITPAIKRIWRHAAATVAASQGLKAYAQKVDSRNKILVLPNGVDLHRFMASKPARPSKNKNKNKNKKIKLLAIGRLIPRKGFQYLINALPEVIKKTKKQCELSIIGSGPYEYELKRLVKQYNLNQHVKFLGLVEYENLPAYYQQADVLINCSYGEGMPLVVLEAMGTGLPIIATKVPGNEELVKDRVNGFLVKPRSSGELAQALIKIINNGKMRQQMAKQSGKTIKNYSWENITEKYVKLYEQAIK